MDIFYLLMIVTHVGQGTNLPGGQMQGLGQY